MEHLSCKPIELSDKPLFDSFFKSHPPLNSELTFTNLFAWRDSKRFRFIEHEHHLIISMGEPHTLLQPIGPDPVGTIKSLLKAHHDLQFERVESSVASQLQGCQVVRDRDMDDYLYSLEDLRVMAGQKYVAKRNFVRRCEKYDPHVAPLDASLIDQCLHVQDDWCNLRDCKDNPTLASENLAVREALNHFVDFGLFGIAVILDGKVQAFAIGEPLNQNTFVDHFEKANTEFEGIYQYLLHQFAKAIPPPYTHINREQDLGVEGLRKAKLSWNPSGFVEKYKLHCGGDSA